MKFILGKTNKSVSPFASDPRVCGGLHSTVHAAVFSAYLSCSKREEQGFRCHLPVQHPGKDKAVFTLSVLHNSDGRIFLQIHTLIIHYFTDGWHIFHHKVL